MKKVLNVDRYVIVDIEDAPRTQRPFVFVCTSEKMKPWCGLGQEARVEDSADEDGDEAADEEDDGAADEFVLGTESDTE